MGQLFTMNHAVSNNADMIYSGQIIKVPQP
jgi:nucleoid-associated protein YgaU